MGLYSWLTADEKKSIKVNKPKNVYLLQPNGKESIEESYYDGYGRFGGIDAYEWLAENNLTTEQLEVAKELIASNPKRYQLRFIGITLDVCYYYVDKNKVCYVDDELFAKVFGLEYFKTFDTILPAYGKSINQLRKEDLIERKSCFNLVKGTKYPLKFSFKKDAVYENLPASRICPKQGR